jgi:ABC-type sugar transport system, periplasmic component
MKKMEYLKRGLTFLLALVFICTMIVGCSKASTTPTENKGTSSVQTTQPGNAETTKAANNTDNYKFAVIKGGINPYFAPVDQAVKDAAKDYGIPVPLIQSPQNWNQNEQNTILDGLVAQGVKAMTLCTSDPVAGNEEISKIVDSGVPVITFAMSPAQPTKSAFCLATDVADSAYQGTKHLIEAMGKKGNIVHLTGNLTDGNTKLRMDAIDKAISEYPDVKLLQTITDIDVAEPAQNAVNSLMAAKRDQIDGVICTAYIPSVAIANAVRKLDEKRIKIVGIDTDQIVIDAIQDGYLVGTMAQNPYGQAYLSVYSMKLFADGFKWKKDAPFLVNSGTLYIEKSNAATYTQDLTKLTKDLVADWQTKYFEK